MNDIGCWLQVACDYLQQTDLTVSDDPFAGAMEQQMMGLMMQQVAIQQEILNELKNQATSCE